MKGIFWNLIILGLIYITIGAGALLAVGSVTSMFVSSEPSDGY